MRSLQFMVLCLSLLILSCNSEKPAKGDQFTIHGNIDGLQNGKVLLVKLDLSNNEQVNVDSTQAENGTFYFEGSVENPYLHSLFLNEDKNKIHFFLENSAIKIEGNATDIENVSITGSREDSLFRSYPMEDIFNRKTGMDIMLNHPDYAFSAFTAYYQFQIFNIELDTLNMIMNGFSAPVKKSYYYEHLNKLYNTLKNVAISQPAPEFAIPDVEGTIQKLSDFKGKYVLIDFWASWCAPCRAVNPELVKVYNSYSDKNFEIIGISVDNDGDRWKKAIEADGLPWVNVSNLNGWDEVSDTYGVKAIPQNFLLDPDGIIIAKNVEPEHLGEKLRALLSD